MSADPLAPWPCVSRHGDARWLAVSVQPGARRTGTDGLHDGTLRVRLAAPPVDGKANQQLVNWLAEQLGCPKRDVALVRGDTSRRKWLSVDVTDERLAEWLAEVLPISSGT